MECYYNDLRQQQETAKTVGYTGDMAEQDSEDLYTL